MSELTIKDKVHSVIDEFFEPDKKEKYINDLEDKLMQLIDSAITEAVTKELTERSEDIEQIINDTYEIGRIDEVMQINNYKTLKPGILKKVQAHIDSAITEAQKELPKGCNCNLCSQWHVEKRQEVLNCKCVCHSHGYIAHDSLCCSTPNVLHSQLKDNTKDKS